MNHKAQKNILQKTVIMIGLPLLFLFVGNLSINPNTISHLDSHAKGEVSVPFKKQ